MIRIHLYHKLPTPYNDFLFRSLTACPGVHLQVYHLWRSLGTRPWTVMLGTGYPNRYLNTRFLGIDWPLLYTAITDRKSFFLVADWAHMSSIAVLIARWLVRAPVSIWADTPQEQLQRPWYKRGPRRVFLNWLLPRMDVLFATGRPGMERVEQMGAPADRIVNLPYFVDLDLPLTAAQDESVRRRARAFRRQVNCEEAGTVFLLAGQCTYKKGQDIAIVSFAECQRRCPQPAGLLVAGEGPLRADLEALAQRLGVAEQIAFLGWLDPTDMLAAYSACDSVVHSARWDPFPLVVLEGMSWGKVVIGSSACGSVQDRVVHGVNGFLFPSEEGAALTEIMARVVADPALQRSIGREARQTAKQWPVSLGVETIMRAAQEALYPHTGSAG